MSIRIRCHCGKLQGELDTAAVAARATCYCTDCRAFARFLGNEIEILDGAGGTEVAAALPSGLRFTEGLDHLACMSLSPKGLYRWYASCCRTPIGNTPRNPKLPYVGVIRACMDASPADLDAALGREHIATNTRTAYRKIEATPMATAWAVLRIGSMIVKSRLGGSYRNNPFFAPGSANPVREPLVISREQRAALG